MLSPCCNVPTYLTDIGPASKMRRCCSSCKATIGPKAPDDATTAKVRADVALAIASVKTPQAQCE